MMAIKYKSIVDWELKALFDILGLKKCTLLI